MTRVLEYFCWRADKNRLPHFLYCSLFALLSFTGCIRLSQHQPARLPQSLPDSLAVELNIPLTNSSPYEEKFIEIERQYTRLELVLPNRAGTSNITIDYYQLRGGKTPGPAIILLPISGGGYEIENHFARYFARHGLAVALVHRIEIGKVTPAAPAIDWWLKQNISNQEQVLDWMQTREELDSRRIGVFGISMGGIQTALLTALDPRVKAAVFGFAAGDLPFVLAHSTEKSIARHRAKFLHEHNMTLEEFQAQLRKAITYDPILLAPYVDPQKVLLVLGMCDTVVPFPKGWELRGKLGRPETVLLPTGHYTALLCLPYVKYRCLQFFRRHLQMSWTPK